MHLTDHLTDVQLNEYLDEATNESSQIESHLFLCDECAARLSTLQSLFVEIESLPELALTRDFAAPFTLRSSLPVSQLPTFLTLTVILQAAIALIVLIIAAPFVIQLIPAIDMPSLPNIFFQLQSQWTSWLDILSTLRLSLGQAFQVPSILEIPILEMSSLAFVLAGLSVLWILGNGLLLRNQMK